MKIWSPQQYISESQKFGVSPDVLSNAIAVSNQMISSDFPVIFTLKHLSQLTNVHYAALRSIVERNPQRKIYKVFKLKKKRMNCDPYQFRIITVPEPALLTAQRWIHERILKKMAFHPCNTAFVPNGGILMAAMPHCGCSWMIKIDIRNYFESIYEGKVYKIFRSIGYQPLVSFELARLCTRVRDYSNPVKKNYAEFSKEGSLPYKTIEIGHLPQGAPTSPLLSNLCTVKLDKRLLAFSIKNNLTYTRYADDIIFSATSDFNRSNCVSFIKEINSILALNGFWPNKNKTKIITPGARKIVLGMLVDGPKPKLTKEYKKEISTHLYFLFNGKVGLKKHCLHKGFRSEQGLLNYLEGKLSFASYIEPEWAAKMNIRYKAIKMKFESGIIP